jgi:hypothetical protein
MSKSRWSATAFLLLILACLGTGPLAGKSQQQPSAEPEPPPSAPQPLTISEQIIRDVLEPLQRGIEEHNRKQVLAVFDAQATPDYARVRDQFTAFFNQYEMIRFRYKLLQVTSEKDTASAVAEVDMAGTPVDETKMAVQRSTQMSFQLKLGDKGWKLVGFKPADFFTQ